MKKLLLLLLALLIGSPAFSREPGPSLRAAPDLDLTELQAEPPAPPEGWVSEVGPFSVVHAAREDARTALRLARYASEAIPRLGEALALPVGRTMHVYVAPSDEQFEAMQPGRVPEWADGTAWPHRGLIYLHAARGRNGTSQPLEQVLDHEIVHVLLGQAFGARPVPTWLQEGLAQLYAKEFKPSQVDRLASGVLGDSLLSLEEITRGFPADPIRAQLAYAQSADLVSYIQSTAGQEAIQVLISEMATGKPVAAALFEATGRPVQELDREWRSRLTRTPIWLKPLTSDTVLFTVAGVAFLFGAMRIRRRNQERLRRWERQEALQDALSAAAFQAWSHPEPERTPAEAKERWTGQDPGRWTH